MTNHNEALAQEYVKLGLALDLHIDGYVDSYFGPPEWRTDAQQKGKLPLEELKERADVLMAGLSADTQMPPQRRDWLTRQVRAMQTSIEMEQGITRPMSQEVQELYDVIPHYIDETVFEESHRALAELLPPGGTLTERMLARREAMKVSFEGLSPLVPALLADLRARTAAKFPLPPNESFEFAPVRDKPWGAYNWYMGNYHSVIEWNTDLPTPLNAFPGGLAHEGYPGHHTEHCIKEHLLVNELGHVEHTITLLNSPECTVAEGVATTALDIVCSPREQIEMYQNTVYPALGLKLDAARELAIDHAAGVLGSARTNGAYLLHEQGKSHTEVAAYLERYELLEPDRANKAVSFLAYPLYRSYAFTYTLGKELLRELFEKRGNPEKWFGRLLTEPVTPQQIRDWTAGVGEAV